MNIFENTPLFDSSIDQPEPNITPYLIEGENNPCILVLPGGGYEILAGHEGEPFARRFNQAGLSAFVLTYRLAPYSYPCQLLDVQRAVKYIKAHAVKFHIDPDRVLICGCSAGGHLAAMACCFTDNGHEGDEVDGYSSAVAGGVLCYPVVSLGMLGHDGTTYSLTHNDAALQKKLSIENAVNENTPPLFVWHTFDDDAVDVRNSLMLANSCKQHNVPIELHIFPHGWHGLGLAEPIPHVAQWTDLCENWLIENGFSVKSKKEL